MSQLSWPGKRRQHVTPDRPADTRWFKSPYVGVVSLRVRKQMSYNASLSRQKDSSEFSTSWCTESVQLYGSTTVSDTFGDGTIENVSITRSGYSSRILEIRSGSMPCSSEITSQNFAPIWLPHWPPWMCTSSRMSAGRVRSLDREELEPLFPSSA